jgi:energy-coupling factor transport system permease protein
MKARASPNGQGKGSNTALAIQGLDPRTKLSGAVALCAAAFMGSSLAGILPGAAVLLIAAFAIRYPPRKLKTVFPPLAPLLVLFFLVAAFTVPGTSIFRLGVLSVSREGILQGFLQLYRLSVFALIVSMLSTISRPEELADGMERILLPLARIGLPAREISIVFTIALRFAPLLVEETDKIITAQEARGASIRSGPILKRMRDFSVVFTPLFVSAARRAERLAEAMETRGYEVSKSTTRLYPLRLKRGDGWGFGIAAAYLGIMIALKSILVNF